MMKTLLLQLLILVAPAVTVAQEGNCVAGGSGYGLAFDWTRLTNTVGLLWRDIPATRHTVEYWYKLNDVHLNSQHILSYSAYNVKGYLGSGGDPYEAANELFFVYNPFEMVLWKGSGQIKIVAGTNPRIADLWNEDWHHLAYTFTTYPKPKVQFFLDGEQLDFASTLVATDATTALTYEKAYFSNNWDVAESPDAEAYYGVDQVTKIQRLDKPPCGDMESNFETVLVVPFAVHSQSDACSLHEQAQAAVKSGAYAIIFEKESADPLFQIPEEGEETINATIPVLAVNAEDLTNTTNIHWTRTREPLDSSYASDYSTPIEPDGVLALGQEPDRPWGDFDPTQAANGCLDEFRVWTSLRTPEQIKQNYKLGVQALNGTELKDLQIYWTFNDPPQGEFSLTTDSSPNGTHPGLVGNLPTAENEITFSDGSRPLPPSAPLRIPTQACPLVGPGQEVVVPVARGATTVIELKSYDPDGDDLLTTILSLPSEGSLWPYVSVRSEGNPLEIGSVVEDLDRTQNKRVIYQAPPGLTDELTFEYQVQDGPGNETISIATVRLIPHIVEEPISQNKTIKEDKLSYFPLARPSQVDQGNMQVVITQLPTRGTLYQAQFNPDLTPLYTSIALTKDQYGPMVPINRPDTAVINSRGLVMYLPEQDGYSANPGEVFDEIKYKFVDLPSGLSSANEGTVGIIVEAVNDPPESLPGSTTVSSDASGVAIQLSSTDVDLDAAESFATRPYSRVTKYPMLGTLYQYNASAPNNNIGSYIDRALKPVPQTFNWASNVLRFSSQYSQCGSDCYGWRNPKCTSNDVLAGGSETGSCSTTGWHASNILGPPNVYPEYVDNKLSWDLSEENEGHEWIELEFPFPVYVSAFEVYETHKPGSIWKISTTGEYLDDPNESCIRETCSTKTQWQTLWTRPRESVTSGAERATIFSPPLCPSTVKSNLVRFDMDTSRALGWNGFDAAKVTGSMDAPPGLLADTENRLVYVPLTGVHGTDQFSFVSSDCLGEGEEAVYSITIEPPAGDNDFVFHQENVDLELEPGQTELTELDLSPTLEKIQDVLQSEPRMTVTLVFSDALGSTEAIFNNITVANSFVELELGASTRGTPFRHIDLWLEDNHLNSSMIFRVRYWIRLRLTCVHGIEDVDDGLCICKSSKWAGVVCSEEVEEESNLGLYVAVPVALVIILALIAFVIYERKQRMNDSMWQVDKKELIFADPPQVVGRGTFGVVLLAEFRGTQVAVKRVIPPKSEKSRDDRLDDKQDELQDGMSSALNTAATFPGMASGMASGYGMSSGIGSGTDGRSSLGGGRFSLIGGGSGSKADTAVWKKMKKDFVEEMRHLSKLRHPCVTTIMGAVLGKDPMLVMEYMDHGSLYDLLHNETLVIENELLVPILRDISQGMRFLHSSDIIHGDLKAANILVDSKFRAKVADFGLTQKQNLGGTGTPFWMAPELLRQTSTNTTATDVYSFGIILYEVYSRRDPYEGENPSEVLRLVVDKTVKKRPPAPRHMPDNIKTLMADCVDEDPENRPSFEELDLRVKRMEVKTVDVNAAKPASSVSLFDIFPRHIAEALRDGRSVEPEHKDSVTIFFSDIVGFTDISATLEPRKVAGMLDRLYTKFDALSQQHDIFKVETIGDAYMAVTNLVKEQDFSHAKRIAEFAIDAIAAANATLIDLENPDKGYVNIRVGFHSGPVVADVVGTRSPRYCLFGDTVNTASRMESNSEVNRIHCSKEAAKLLRKQCPDLPLTSRGKIPIKGKGVLHTYWVNEGGENKRRPSRARLDSDIEKAIDTCVGDPLDDVVEESSCMEMFSDEFSGPLDLPSSQAAPPEAPQTTVTDARSSTKSNTPTVPHAEQPVFVAKKAADPEVGLFSDELSV